MKSAAYLCLLSLLFLPLDAAETSTAKETIFPQRPLGITVSIKMAGPYMEPADLQIIGLFEHKATGDTYQSAAKETDDRLGGILSALRDRGEFTGARGETILFSPPAGTIPAKRFMVVGLGEEKDLSLAALEVAGRVAAREAVRLSAKHIAWAPVIRDQGNTKLDVGETDRAFIGALLSSYDTEKRLQAQGLAARFSIESVVIEAGPAYFDSAVTKVGEGITTAIEALAQRPSAPYRRLTP